MTKPRSAQAKPGAEAPAAFGFSQARAVAACKAAEYLTTAVFAVTVPRLMGPMLYGQFALLFAFVSLLTMICGMGALSTFGRFVPDYRAREQMAMVRALFTQILFVRLALVLVLIGPVALALATLLPDASATTMAAGVAAVGFSVVGATFYELLYGLNALGKWLLPNALSKGVLLVLILLLGGATRLEGAAIALLATYAIFFAFGLYWTRSFLSWARLILDWSFLYGHLRFGILLFVSGLLIMAIVRLGEIAVATVSGDPREVAYFSLASVLMLTMYTLIGHMSRTIVPTLALFHASGEDWKVFLWLGCSLKYLSILTFAFLLGVLGAGRLGVAAVWGAAFLPVASNLEILAAGLLASPLIALAISLAIIYERPERMIPMSGAALVVFASVTAVTVPAWGALGASTAVTLGLACAALLACVTFWSHGLREILATSRFKRQLAVGLVSAMVVAAPWTAPAVRGPVALVLYATLLLATGVLEKEDARRAARVLGIKGVGSSHTERA